MAAASPVALGQDNLAQAIRLNNLGVAYLNKGRVDEALGCTAGDYDNDGRDDLAIGLTDGIVGPQPGRHAGNQGQRPAADP